MSKLLRLRALVVFALVLVIVGGLWWLFMDELVERGVETTGESIVGARVEIDELDVRAASGSIHMSALRIANPEAPMRNLMEADEVTVDLMLSPMLEKKVVVENLVVTGVRFDTPRETSGALTNPDPQAGQLWRSVDAWADQIELPELSLETLTGVVRTEAIATDSLRTVQYARDLIGRADSLRGSWESTLTSIDPRPRIDSAQALVARLEAFRPTPLNALQIPDLLDDARTTLAGLEELWSRVASLDEEVRTGIESLDLSPQRLEELRQADLAYARSLLNIPSLDAPTMSPALLGRSALTWMKPVLYWARVAERYMPPGLDPRARPGPRRARAEGLTVEFPGRARWPAFLVERGEIGLEIGGDGAAAGVYTALMSGLTTTPSLVDRPLAISVDRTGSAQGPSRLALSAVIDHTTEVVRDSVGVAVSGVNMPTLDLAALGGSLSLGAGESTLRFLRAGNEIDARLRWSSGDVSWVSAAGTQGDPASAPLGSAEWARGLVVRTLASLGAIEVEMGLSGDIESPSLIVSSNVGEAVAASLRRELGTEIENAEARLREEVAGRIDPLVLNARSQVDGARSEVAARVANQREEIEELRERLEQRIEALAGSIALPIPGC